MWIDTHYFQRGMNVSTDLEEQRDIATMIQNTAVQFNEAINSQKEQSRRMDHRNSQIIRYGASFAILLSIGVVFLAWSLKHDMKIMSNYMQRMARDVSTMSNATTQMQTSMSTMEGGINEVVSHTQSISSSFTQTSNSLGVMSHIGDSVGLMQSDLRGLNTSIGDMNSNIRLINKQMRNLNRNLGAMGNDVNRMSSPAKMFPF